MLYVWLGSSWITILLFKYSSSHVTSCVHSLWVCISSSHIEVPLDPLSSIDPVSTSRSHFLIKVYRYISWILPRIIWSMYQNHHHESSYGIDGSWDLRSRSLLFRGRVSASDRSSIPILSFRLAPPISFLGFLPFTKIPASSLEEVLICSAKGQAIIGPNHLVVFRVV